MDINVKRKTLVKPAEKTPLRRLWLSELDLFNNNMHTPTIYFFRTPPHSTGAAAKFFDAETLMQALARVLVPFYPMAGRFGLDGDGRLEIDCNGEGVLFVEAEVSAAIDEFKDFAPTAELRRLFPAVDYSGGVDSYPLLVSQVTYFRCGGVSLGVASEHRVVDGPSHFDFVNSWAHIAYMYNHSQYLPHLINTPHLDRTILRPRDPPTPISYHIEYQITDTPKRTEPLTSKISLFKLTTNHLKTLKDMTKQDHISSNYTRFEIVAGHIWKCTLFARQARFNDEETRIYFSTNGRNSRLKPPLPSGYFGNVVFTSVSIARVRDIKEKPLGYAARHVRDTLARVDNEYLRSAIDYLKMNGETRRYMDHNFRSPNVSLTSWIGMPLYEADFGWGRPFYVGPGAVSSDEGKATIWPTGDGNGSLYVVISLRREHMEVFEKVFYAFDEMRWGVDLLTSSSRAKL